MHSEEVIIFRKKNRQTDKQTLHNIFVIIPTTLSSISPSFLRAFPILSTFLSSRRTSCDHDVQHKSLKESATEQQLYPGDQVLI